MSGFADLGLSAGLVDAAASLGWDAPLPVQRAAIPVLRRGGNAVLRASSGSGVTGAYGLALLDRLSSGEAGAGTRALVLVPSAPRAATVASTLVRLAPAGIRVAALMPGWRAAGSSTVLVATPAAAAAAVADSALKLSALETLVLDGAPALLAPAAASALDAVLVSIPAESQRVLTTPSWQQDVDDFAEAHARRALSIPARAADPDSSASPRRGSVAYAIVPARDRDDVLARLLEGGSHRKVVARSPARAADVRAVVRARGYDAGGADGLDVAHFASDDAGGATLAYDVPADAAALARLDTANAIVLVAPSEQPHLRAIAGDAGLALTPAPLPPAPPSALSEYHDEIRRALEEEDVDAQLAALEPLFDEVSPAEVAAALSALLRRRRPPPARTMSDTPTAPAAGRGSPFVRLFVSSGQKDGIRPAEIVGAFTSEAGIAGDQVGRIEIRETFSVVEVDPGVADRVIRALNGTTLRNRSIRVDYDRKRGAPAPRRAPPGARPSRGKGEPRG